MGNADFLAGPEGGKEASGEKTSSGYKSQKTSAGMRKCLTFSISSIWLGTDAYVLYGFCYNVLWHHIRPRHQKAAIAILVLTGWCNLHAMISFIAIHAYGPGKITDDYSKPVEDQLNEAFLCDPEGYQMYCTYCRRVKPNRTHHSAHTDTCVPVMDHFCPWVGSVIGQGNYKFFLQYMWSGASSLLIVLVTLLVYQHDPLPGINGNSIALYIVCGAFFAFFLALIVQHSSYVLFGHTTLEQMSYRRSDGPYFNILWRGDSRRVVQAPWKEIVLPNASPYNQGLWQNIRFVLGPVYTWTLPVRPKIREPVVSKDFLAKVRTQLDADEHPRQ